MERQPASLQGQPLSRLTSLSSTLPVPRFHPVFPLSNLTACSGVQPRPLCLARPAGRRGRRRLRRHPPLPPRPALPLTSDPVSADPQLDINSRSPESQPGAPSGPRAGAQSPAQQVRGTNSQSWGSEGAQEAVAKTPAAAASRRAKDADSSPADALHPQKPRSEQPPLPWVGGGVTRLRAPRSWPGLRGPGARRAAQLRRPRSAPSRGAAPESTRWAGLMLPPELRSGLEIRSRHHVNRRGESREDMRAPGAQAGP